MTERTYGGMHIEAAEKPHLSTVVECMTSLGIFIETVYRALIIKDLGLHESNQLDPDVEMEAQRRFGEIPQNMRVSRIHMDSPLEVLIEWLRDARALGVGATVVYLFENPEKIGGFIPRVVNSWYIWSEEAKRAKKAHKTLDDNETDVDEIDP